MNKTYFLFDKPTKIGIGQFSGVLLVYFILNLNKLYIDDKYLVLLLGSSLFLAFALISYDQTKIFHFKFRITGLLSSLLGLALIYSPIILYTLDIINYNLWIDVILIGFCILSVSVISDYYLIGVPEIVRAIRIMIDFIKKIPFQIFNFFKIIFKYIFLIIPIFLYVSIFVAPPITSESLFVTLLIIMIFLVGLSNVKIRNLSNYEQKIRQQSKGVIDSLTTIKWKIDSKISQYKCQECLKPIAVTDNICENCKSQIRSCLICKLPLKVNQRIINCETCIYPFHFNHWNFWISNHKSCPNCKTVI